MHQGGRVKSDYAYTIIKHTHLSSYTRHLLLDISNKATFTPYSQPNLGVPHSHHPLTSAINTLLAILDSSILSTFPIHLNTTCQISLYLSFSMHLFIHNYPFVTLPPNFSRRFISRTFTFLFSALLIPHDSAPYNAIGTISYLYRHFFVFMPNPLQLSTHFTQ